MFTIMKGVTMIQSLKMLNVGPAPALMGHLWHASCKSNSTDLPNFMRKAKLFCWKHLKPRPPKSLLQLTESILPLFSDLQRNFLYKSFIIDSTTTGCLFLVVPLEKPTNHGTWLWSSAVELDYGIYIYDLSKVVF
ncbi:hypothetical protein NE237_009796 [Protea cynaroides]|uniref:Uncharacterized protein n=1 Tax=Protea cynaroides TaxID=273540 RepID=A0A9Q0KYH9_9MAGN|nr:hypothetical protein NE237_009796 [Protea cynaroides]